MEGAEVRDVGGVGRGEHQVWGVGLTSSLQLDLPKVVSQGLTGTSPAKVNLDNIHLSTVDT